MQDHLFEASGSDAFFAGFEARTLHGEGADIFCRIGGGGQPVLLLHGYPQTSAMWHRVAPALAAEYTVICPDLRGYGRSSKPESDPDHFAYSKRATAGDLVAIMDRLGHKRFLVAGHDRGGRVAHRLAADYPGRVAALAVLDIAPTREMYRETGDDFARKYWHWFFLIQPAPFPERMITADPDAYWLAKCGSGSAGLAPFAEPALQEYLAAFRNPETIRASCEDYRAAASIDIAHDDADGSRKLDMPVLALWGDKGVIGRCFDPLGLWRERANDVEGHALPGGHYLAEEQPEAVIAALRPFFGKAIGSLQNQTAALG